MPPVRPPSSTSRREARTLTRVIQARRRLDTLPRGGGRAWVNGREVGGPDARFGHLAQSHD